MPFVFCDHLYYTFFDSRERRQNPQRREIINVRGNSMDCATHVETSPATGSQFSCVEDQTLKPIFGIWDILNLC